MTLAMQQKKQTENFTEVKNSDYVDEDTIESNVMDKPVVVKEQPRSRLI